ncbi:hypothetical protein RB195_023885 [Necator americanus]|uniref:Uncharacterized protein n=1 Tax=Necator americanus TaxID=51031 RepID=A0ABR1EKY6_NECAM
MSLLYQSIMRDRIIVFFERFSLTRRGENEVDDSPRSSSLRLSVFKSTPSWTTSTTNMNGLWNIFTTVRGKRRVSKPPRDACLRKLYSLELIHQRGAARAAGNQELTSELARLCRETIKEDLEERRAEVLAEAAEAGQSIRYTRDGNTE